MNREEFLSFRETHSQKEIVKRLAKEFGENHCGGIAGAIADGEADPYGFMDWIFASVYWTLEVDGIPIDTWLVAFDPKWYEEKQNS